ncbi:MAG: aminodeoxychorismate/anthranilate synthase component II [Odoribacter sp.]|nr:aminodeoxychorismate/anthranilate synthase component II [Odoribacter sp.]
MKKILILDNYDSFTYNIVHIVNELGFETDVYRNDKISLEEIDKYDKIILSPGPGIPCEAGILTDLIKHYAATKSILGICLGEQAIGECFGAKLNNLMDVYHGLSTPVMVKEKDYLFEGLEEEFEAGRYHSWVVSNEHFPECLTITAVDGNGEIMAISHKTYDVKGVQFHPESILTPSGKTILSNWLNN